jgi:hypothetical protein
MFVLFTNDVTIKGEKNIKNFISIILFTISLLFNFAVMQISES